MLSGKNGYRSIIDRLLEGILLIKYDVEGVVVVVEVSSSFIECIVPK